MSDIYVYTAVCNNLGLHYSLFLACLLTRGSLRRRVLVFGVGQSALTAMNFNQAALCDNIR